MNPNWGLIEIAKAIEKLVKKDVNILEVRKGDIVLITRKQRYEYVSFMEGAKPSNDLDEIIEYITERGAKVFFLEPGEDVKILR